MEQVTPIIRLDYKVAQHQFEKNKKVKNEWKKLSTFLPSSTSKKIFWIWEKKVCNLLILKIKNVFDYFKHTSLMVSFMVVTIFKRRLVYIWNFELTRKNSTRCIARRLLIKNIFFNNDVSSSTTNQRRKDEEINQKKPTSFI